MFKFLRVAATKASLQNTNRGLQVLISICNRGADAAAIQRQLADVLNDADLAICNSKKTDKPMTGSDLIEVMVASLQQQGVEVGNASSALGVFYNTVFAKYPETTPQS